MRLFVNVYHPINTNCFHHTQALAERASGGEEASGVKTVEIEFPGTRDDARERLENFSAEELLAHYPVPKVEAPEPKYLIKTRFGSYYKARGEGTTDNISKAHHYTDAEAKLVSGDDKSLTVIMVTSGDAEVFSSPAAADAVTVGDLQSTARGSGARKSAGKPDWSQLPWWVIGPIFNAWKSGSLREQSEGTLRVIELMSQWQRGRDVALDDAAALLLEIIHAPAGRSGSVAKGTLGWFPVSAFEPVVRVLEFGAKKYAKGNWAKGMSWSVCFTCTMSHLGKAFQGAENDAESGLPHLAHALCNMLFLLGYRDLYPEGDDRLPEFRPATVDCRHD